ncbi:rho guanine nucleotide exchange factor 1-like isoform X1 [Salvelinus namaycush]|uniref:Rho guanine nucleotide exchange factor 1-like isoform X1 n=1 Tax=Salvelinus namaycush TaxID=8040 RepID=A0A8U0UEH7_SALNM|nr:rho guanine nucleotide exchange factor 1-like isoform X1 [Salvelinus namaycush]XP_038850689.1 rho guanine nucleotide exchange factor 1-like isoform X1 [Salvelinus namaycush]
MSIIGAEDEDFENDLDPTVDDHSSHFTSIELVKSRPTHLLVFLQHVILQFDCSSLLCYLHADLFKNLSTKETKKQFVEFYNSFLDKSAILRVQIPHNVSFELDRTRPDLLSEEQQRKFVQDVQLAQAPEVLRQLEDFRQKRMMGMTPNAAELLEVESHYPTDRIPMEMKEKAVAETLLDKMSEIHPSIVADEEKCSSIFAAVAFYMKHLGVKSRVADSKKSRGFFRRPLGKNKKSEESTKSKPKGGFPNILSAAGGWIAGSAEVKLPKVEAEVDKEKVNQERKVSSVLPPSRGSSAPDAAPPALNRKSVSTGSSPHQGLEVSEGPVVHISVTSSPDFSHSEIGLFSSRSDPHLVAEGGELSPAGMAGGLAIWELPSPNEPPLEENLDKDSVDEGVLLPEGVLPGLSLSGHTPQQEEQDPRLLELEQDPPNWREHTPPDTLKDLSKKETKRQEVINELFATEHAHVRMLSVLQTVFWKPLEREELMTATELATIFPSLDEIIDMHYAFYEHLKKLRQHNFIVKAIGTTLLNRFGGTEGEWFQKLTSRFCSHQTWALEQLKMRQKKDPRFNSFILEAESRPQCRRLQLKDIIPTEMQRLTKYPLLLENIAKCTEDTLEKESIQQSAECCRKILNHVNEEVKQMENLLTLKDYQRRLDTSGLKPSNELYLEYKYLDLAQRRMIYEGPLTWRVTKEKTLEVQCVLLGDLLVLLQKQDDKMVLKCQSKSNIAVQEGKQMLSPIIKLDSAFLREVATDRKAFYVIFTWDSGAQIYELVAQSVGERKNWTDVIKMAVDELKKTGPPSDLKRGNSILTGGGNPYSPTTFPQPPLSPTENGGVLLKNSIERDKNSLTDEMKSVDSRHSLIYYLSDKGFDLIGNSDQVKVANSALNEVMSLKRLLVGSISLSDDSQPDEQNGREGPESQDQGLQGEEEGGGEGGGMKIDEEGGISAPLVLSQERMEEVRRKLQSLEVQLKRLQSVEEEHHRLQQALSKFSLEGGNF